MPSQATKSKVKPFVTLLRGLSKRCPYCGSGKLFRRWFTMVETCPKCHVKFEREPGFFLGATTMNLAFMLVACGLVIAVGFGIKGTDGSILPMMIAGGCATILLPPLLYPFSKTLWCAVDLIMRKTMGEQFGSRPTRPS
jgi:Protein of unknown function (DUF983)